ncbi:MAG TPA: monovalent cation/H(+) antiporter subunit G [Candidatus Sulfomarinibacteraceae bacterium]|nr:monovalent cation/H(+) antiporter subunit G [Candidatus Sulfomarinibacteraceae bacterium]
MTVQEWIIVFLIYFGTFFMLVAAIGLNRMPDLYTRMHGAAKSTTLGVTAIIVATAVYFVSSDAITRAILVVVFFFLTAPVAGHVLARSAYFRDVMRWQGTVLDELEDHLKEEERQAREREERQARQERQERQERAAEVGE